MDIPAYDHLAEVEDIQYNASHLFNSPLRSLEICAKKECGDIVLELFYFILDCDQIHFHCNEILAHCFFFGVAKNILFIE